MNYRLSDNPAKLKAERAESTVSDHMAARKWLKAAIKARHNAAIGRELGAMADVIAEMEPEPVSFAWANPARIAHEHAAEVAQLHAEALRHVGF